MKFNKSPGFTFTCIQTIENLQAYLDGKLFGRNIKINCGIVFEIEYIFLTVASEEFYGNKIFELGRFAIQQHQANKTGIHKVMFGRGLFFNKLRGIIC